MGCKRNAMVSFSLSEGSAELKTVSKPIKNLTAMKNDIIPKRDADFNDFQTIVCPYLNTRAVALGLDAGEITDMLALHTSWDTNWALYINAATRTPGVITTKSDTKLDLSASLRELIQDAKRSPALNDTDRTTLNLPDPNEVRTIVKPPTSVPDIEVRKIEHLIHVLSITNPDEPDSRAKPKGVASIELFKALSIEKPKSMNDFKFIGTYTRTLFTVKHTMEEMGQTAWYICRYVSTRGDAGPWSDVISSVVA